MNELARLRYERWKEYAETDKDVAKELKVLAGNDEEIEEAFSRDLTFGTGGLRGIIGAGTSRMNIYTVGRASQGLANYLLSHGVHPSVVIGYDSRIKSDLFAETAAGVFAANGLHVYIWPKLMPVPMVSFAVRYLHASAGVMITASHNPARYNGYKVYGSDGCQITNEAADAIFTAIEKLDVFNDVQKVDFKEGLSTERIHYIEEEVCTAFIREVRKQSVLYDAQADRGVKIVYTPLNGAGREPVLRALQESGFFNISLVKEQEQPDGHFPTCPYPNPEAPEAMKLGLAQAQKTGADILLATDPDCDRVGVAVPNGLGEYVLLTGNETGLLLLDYICARRMSEGMMPDHPVAIKTIVTSDLGEKIAEHYGVQMRDVLTGFKYIGETIGRLEWKGEEENFIFGFEESYGYLTGSYIRDKDGVGASLMICDMLAYYKAQGITLLEKLNKLYAQYGYYLNTLHSYSFEGIEGCRRIQNIMAMLRRGISSIGPKSVQKIVDYLEGQNGLPKADVLKFLLEGECSVVVRPSGTEPKLKIYISIKAQNSDLALEIERRLLAALEAVLQYAH